MIPAIDPPISVQLVLEGLEEFFGPSIELVDQTKMGVDGDIPYHVGDAWVLQEAQEERELRFESGNLDRFVKKWGRDTVEPTIRHSQRAQCKA